MFNRNDVLSKLRLIKARLGKRGGFGRYLVPAVEVCEFCLSHGLREVIVRARARLGLDRSAAESHRRGDLASIQPGAQLIVPAAPGEVAISFVLAASGAHERTRQALAGIVAHTAPGSYEIIVVVRAGDPELPDLDGRTTGVTFLRHAAAPSSSGALNDAVERARGAVVCFLDGATALMDPGPRPILDLLASDRRIAAVGPMLMTENREVRSGGTIVWNDGTVCEYRHDGQADAPETNFVREVDACRLAGLVVRRGPFRELGGFDPSYEPEAYGCLDLCFRLRERGDRVVYQPSAAVVCRDATADAPPSGGETLTHQRQRFCERHATALSRQATPGDLRDGRDRRRGLRVVVVESKMPRPDRDSGSVRLTAILRMLSELGHRPTFVAEEFEGSEADRQRLRLLGVEVVYGAWAAHYLARHGSHFDVAVLCRMAIASTGIERLRAIPRPPAIVFDTVDLHFVREERQAVIERSPTLAASAAETRITEVGLMRLSNRVWVTSSFEADLLGSMAPLPRVDVVPNVHEVAAAVSPFVGREHILFIGGFLHPPNEDAVLFFVEQIFPHVRARLPGVKFLVVGSDMPARIRRLANDDISIMGHVPDVVPLFEHSRLSVAPLRYGAGVKGKVTQSLAHGLPVVATSIAAEGLDLVSGEHLMIADEPGEFASCLVDLYTDEETWTRLSAAGRRHIDARLGYESVKASIRDIFEELATHRSA